MLKWMRGSLGCRKRDSLMVWPLHRLAKIYPIGVFPNHIFVVSYEGSNASDIKTTR